MSSVVSFSAAIARRARPRADRGWWSAAEIAELMRLFGACRRDTGAATFETGETETGDPQFYIIGTGPDFPCIAFASRIGESVDGSMRYVVQDANGEVVAEGGTAAAVIDIAVSALAPPRRPRRIMPYLVRSIAVLLSCGVAREPGWLDEFWIEIADSPLLEMLIGYAA